MTDSSGPLSGLRIIEIKGIGPGPYAGMLLADMGAEVIVVERSSRASGIGLPSAHDIHSRGKKSIALNLKSAEGLAVLMQLVETADALFEGFRPGVAEKLGFGPADCHSHNPKLVYGRMTGWGQTGPLAARAGHDINYIGLSGALAAMGPAHKPSLPLNLVGDYAGGSLFLVMGMLAALLEVPRTGVGRVVDAAITDGTASLMGLFYGLHHLGLWQNQRAVNLLDGAAHFYDTYETADGKFMAVGPIEPAFYQQLLDLTGLDCASQMPEDWVANKAQLADFFRQKTRDQWAQLFEQTDACVTPVLDFIEAAEHPHQQARGAIQTVDGVLQPGPAPRFDSQYPDINSHRPSEGQDTAVLLQELGYSGEHIAQLKAQGVLT